MLYNFRNRAARLVHELLCRHIRDTPPLTIRAAPLLLCSMVSERDLIMYLVAIKSIYRQIGEGQICILNDGSLRPESVALLRSHLGEPAIVDIASVNTGPCPRGGCWERLLHLLDLAAEAYVIQVDSDLVARGPLPEVMACYRENRSFTMGTYYGQDFIDLTTASRFAQGWGGNHIQMLAERALASLPDAETRLYVRGCAGFAGFARGSSRRPAEEFSAAMQGLIGNEWKSWGSEQVTSCYVVANSPGARVLPITKYANFSPRMTLENTALVHFLGQTRFYRGRYAGESRRIVAALSSDRK